MRWLLIIVSLSGFLFARDYQIEYQNPVAGVHQLTFNLDQYQITTVTTNEGIFSKIRFSSSTVLQKKGYAELPFVHATIQIAPLKNVRLNIVRTQYEEINLEHAMLPSRGVIYRNQDPDTIPYWTDPQSIVDAFYPDSLALLTRPFILKDVRGVTVYFYPFQYNAQKQTLRIYHSIEISVEEIDTTPVVNPLIRKPDAKILPEMDAVYRSTFLNYTTASTQTLDYGQHGDLLVIATARDTAAIRPYIKWKREKGFNVSLEVVAPGTNVKNLIQQKYDANNNLLYVQLVGDWADVQSDLGTSENAPMDPQLGCVVGDDYYADISVGRLSANSANEVTVQVNKIIEYEKSPQNSATWYESALGIGSAEGSGSGDDGEMDKDHIQVIWDDKLDPFTYNVYSTAYDPGATDVMVADAVNNGVSIINYCGHGSMTSWGTSGFDNNDVNNLSNGSMLPFIFSVACVNGAFDDGDCFAEAWLRKDGGGAVMFLGSTINQPWQPPMRGQDYFNDLIIGGYDYDAHPGQNGINTTEQRTFVGSIVINGFALMLNESNSSSDVETIQTWSIFGDPSMQIRTAPPAELTLSNTDIEAGTPFTTTVTSSGQPVKEAMVCISQNGAYYSGLTDANGNVTIDHNFTEGNALLVVTAFNTQTVYQTVTVGTGQGPHVVVNDWSVNDNSTGNGNGAIEYLEQFYLDVNAKNIGNEPAVDVQGHLSTSDSYLTVQDNQYFYGFIDTAQVVNGPQAFLLQAKDGVPDQHQATCEVVFSDTSTKTWTSEINLTINAPDLDNSTLSVDDQAQGDGNGVLDPGENADLVVPTFNQGHAASQEMVAYLTTSSSYVTILTDSVIAGVLSAGDTAQCAFAVQVAADDPQGERATFFYRAVAGAYVCKDTFTVNIGGKLVYLMQDGSFTVTDGLFYDSGGKDSNYSTSESYTLTFYPLEGSVVKAIFHSFQTTANYDRLYVYDGADVTAPEVPGSPFSGTNSPGEITASNAQGALTFRFVSNPLVTDVGWEADIFSTVISANRDLKSTKPHAFRLFASYPNPFNPQTTIRYQIPVNVSVTVQIFDVMGREVRRLWNGKQSAGTYRLIWNGKDNAGRQLPSGIYFVQVLAGKYKARQKILLVK